MGLVLPKSQAVTFLHGSLLYLHDQSRLCTKVPITITGQTRPKLLTKRDVSSGEAA